LTAKDLETEKVGKTGILGAICYQIATNFLILQPSGPMGWPCGISPAFLLIEQKDGLCSIYARGFLLSGPVKRITQATGHFGKPQQTIE